MSKLKLKPWELLSSELIYESKWYTVLNNTYKLPDGKIGENYFHLKRRSFVLVLALNSNNQIIVERTYRQGVKDFVYELPAGWIDEGEEPLEAAKRELLEETGYEAEGEVVNYIYPQPGYMEVKAYIVFMKVKNSDFSKINHGHDEHIEVEWVDLSKVKKMVAKGDIRDMGFLSALTQCAHLLP